MQNQSLYILLVDDDPINLLLLEELLDSEGYATRSAASGDRALEIAAELRPGLILLDVMMPEMDGFEVCQRLRKDENLQTVPVIFLTALDDDESRLKGLELMGDDYMTKPINSSLLLAKISSTLRLHQLRSQQADRQVLEGESRAIANVQEKNQRQLDVAWQINEDLTEKFRLFVPEQFLKRIAPKGVDSIQLGNAKEEEVTILFCDIRGFTAIAETQEATQTFAWLNAFFTEMNHAIAANHGFIDKYLGDAIMAVFDRPKQHVTDGINAGVAMRESLKKFNRDRQRFNLKEPINIGIGMHSGWAVLGTIGSDRRMDSTVIGDVVNTASRIESLTKTYGCQMIISDTVVKQLVEAELFHLRWIDKVVLSGKQQNTVLYEVLGHKTNPLDERKVRSQSLFDRAIGLWQQEDFTVALKYFQRIIEQDPTDKVAVLYRERCLERLRKQEDSCTAIALNG